VIGIAKYQRKLFFGAIIAISFAISLVNLIIAPASINAKESQNAVVINLYPSVTEEKYTIPLVVPQTDLNLMQVGISTQLTTNTFLD